MDCREIALHLKNERVVGEASPFALTNQGVGRPVGVLSANKKR